MSIERRKITNLIPYENNPRTHSDKQVKQLAQLMERYGFYDSHAIAVDEEGTIIWGHGRLLAAKELGLEEVPVEVLSDLSEEDKKALRIADNGISEQSNWEMESLQQELMDLDALDFPMELLSLSEELLEELFDDDNSQPPPSLDELEQEYGQPQSRDFWPYIKVQVSPQTKQKWDDLMNSINGDDEALKVEQLLDRL